MAFVKIENKEVGVGKPTYVVAEAGLNHNGDIHIAKKQVDKAVECGADAIKFQTYKTEEFLTYNCGYFNNFKKAELSYEEFGELKDYSKNKGITFFSAPFDIESADYLDKIGVPCFKIASSDLTNIPLIKNIAKKGKPMIISTGVANLSEVENTINFCTSQNNRDIILLHCVANYPTQPTEANLSVMNTMRQKLILRLKQLFLFISRVIHVI